MAKRIAHVVPALSDRIAGTKSAVSHLSGALAKCGVISEVFSTKTESTFEHNGVRIQSISNLSLDQYDLLVFAEVFDVASANLASKCARAGVPYILSPHSSFVRQAWKYHRLRKELFIHAYKRGFVRNALALHFLCEEEAQNSFTWGKEILLSGNGVDHELLRYSSDAIRNARTLGFLGRLNVNHKGLDTLLQAMQIANSSPSNDEVELLIHGPDFRNGKSTIAKMIAQLNLERCVKVLPALTGEDKLRFFSQLTAFVHTSRYEGQPLAVLEALALGCPVIVTPGTNMVGVVEKHRMGLASQNTPTAIAAAIRRFVGLGKLEQSVISENAKSFATANLDWDGIAANLLESIGNRLNWHRS